MMVTKAPWSIPRRSAISDNDRGREQHTNIFVRQLMGKTDSLRLVLDRLAVDDGRFELLRDTPMDGVALRRVSILLGSPNRFVAQAGTHKVFHSAPGRPQHDRRRVIGQLALGLGVRPDEVEFLPPVPSKLVMSLTMNDTQVRKAYMASINSSTFHPCSELIGTELGMR